MFASDAQVYVYPRDNRQLTLYIFNVLILNSMMICSSGYTNNPSMTAIILCNFLVNIII